ncbi:Inner membrane ABC transporter permease protein YjfF [Sodalis glossinidius str. 'morsitans']|uniref:Inner membrane ABC transporter permease protein YjfF n=1 Tax=Sodalis glossinidius (strain morsitans) TaxID=343509 RepID=Q2NQ99_SODGM|nr:putative sugar ABC transporter permease component [Sodalis glossinidius str. 'morsitans']CRL46768.1 Inner membrane ABC transporter permease protein YjfF [Sodalis glossinidius str. 'morsitans']
MLKRNLPLAMTIVVFIAGYLYCLSQYPGFASTRVIGDLLTDNAFLGIVAVGMTFVIFSGGIDLSVGSTIAFTSVLLAKMIGEYDVPPGLAFVIVLALIMLLAAGVLWRTVHASALRLRDGRQRLFSRSDGRAGEEHDGADLHAIKFSGGVIRYRVFSLYLSRLCSGGQRRGTGYYRGGGHWRYVIDRWRRHPVRRLVWVMI